MSSSIRTQLEEKATHLKARIVYPEPSDERIVQAAAEVARRGIAEPVLVGTAQQMPASLPAGVQGEVINDSDRLEQFAEGYAASRGLRMAAALRLVSKPQVYAGMMVKYGYADGMVSGIAHPTSAVLTAAGLAIGYREGIAKPSSCFIMVVPRLGERRDVPLVFADCAVNIEPTASELAEIALTSARTTRQLLGLLPRVAMLSFSTKGSASHASVDKVRSAAAQAAQKIQHGFVEGEFQLDAALVPSVARKKVRGESNVAGQANVLIFPDLNAGNIAYKAVQYLAGAEALGPILQGFAKPVNDLSRGATPEDVVTVTAITVLQSAE